jgi:perosamine synthetase
MIPVYKPFLPARSMVHARAALESTWLSSRGRYCTMVPEKLSALMGSKHALLVNSGTAATHLLSYALRFRHPDITALRVPNNVYVAAWNAFLHNAHFDLRPIDADLATWNLDPSYIHERSAAHTAFLIVHNLGNIVNVPSLKRLLPRTAFVEDCCEGLLGKYEGAYAGTASLACSLSFHGNKTITSGEGGAVLTNDTELFEYLRDVADQGRTEERFLHSHAGYNYRMTNLQAALLLGQIEVLSEILERKSVVFRHYLSNIDGCEFLLPQAAPVSTERANWMFGVRIPGSPGFRVADPYFAKLGIEIRPMFHPMSAHGHLRRFSAFPEGNARILRRECVILPSYPELQTSEIDYICEALRAFSREHCGHAIHSRYSGVVDLDAETQDSESGTRFCE